MLKRLFPEYCDTAAPVLTLEIDYFAIMAHHLKLRVTLLATVAFLGSQPIQAQNPPAGFEKIDQNIVISAIRTQMPSPIATYSHSSGSFFPFLSMHLFFPFISLSSFFSLDYYP